MKSFFNRTPQVRSFHHRSSPSLSNISPSFTTSSSSDTSSSTPTDNRIRLHLAPATAARFVRVNSQRSEDSAVAEDDDEAGFFLLGNVGNWAIVSSCLVGLLTGIGVVAFNNGVHELRDFFWDGIPSRGASWLREAPIEGKWARVILVPASGGLVVGMLNWIRSEMESEDGDNRARAALRPILKAVAACVTLGTGNSLGPEGPSVEIGASVAKGVGKVFDRNPKRRNSLVAAGSAAGISSGFNAAVAGCFFAVESVLWPSSEESSLSLTNTTSAVILSAVIASIVSEVGLGSEPAFKVPVYDFRSPGEIPLYLLLGAICGLVSLALSRCTSYMLTIADNIHESTPIPRTAFPFLGGLSVGLIALAYPEILYWGFENVDILIESRPFVKGLSAELLLQLVAVKIIATSLCRASGLVGGYYAPSLFIGAATGTAYGKLISLALAQSNSMIDFSLLEVASPQAYGLVGMAATLAGVCQVPLTSVLLLFELTQDYRIVLPLLGAVGLSSWVTSGQSKRKDVKKKMNEKNKKINSSEGNTQPPDKNSELSSASQIIEESSSENNLCEVESSLCLEDSGGAAAIEELEKRTFVSQAMRTRYVTVLMSTSLSEAVALMLVEKQACAVVVDGDNVFVGLLTLEEIQEFSKSADTRSVRPKELLVSELCSSNGGKCRVPWTVLPSMNLLHARILMEKHGLTRVPVIVENVEGQAACPVGILDRESISLTCRALATRESLG